MTTGFSLPESVADAYGVGGAEIETLSGGRTNRTMRVRAGRDLVVQQMRADSHFDLLGVMENLVRVTAHLDWKRRTDHGGGSWYPQLVATSAGRAFVMTESGDVWRAFSYRPGQIVRAAQPLRSAASIARLYGRFLGSTADLGGPPLVETAPGFHDLEQVFDRLMGDLDAADSQRRADLAEHHDRIASLRDRIDRISAADGLHEVPKRVVHNDTKFSNVLLDHDRGEAIAVLDLDLAMMGPAWHDLGDLIRSACWNRPGGTGPGVNELEFASLVESYVEGAEGTLSGAEIATFAVACPRLSLELGLRYLNDHLRDEPHLRVDGVKGHLVRGLANLMLAEEMLGAYDALRPIVETYTSVSTVEPEGIE